MLEQIDKIGPAATLLVLLAQVVGAVAFWALKKSFVKVEDYNALADTARQVTSEVAALKSRVDALPPPTDTKEIEVSLAKLGGDIRELAAIIDGQGKSMDRLATMLDRLHDHELNQHASGK